MPHPRVRHFCLRSAARARSQADGHADRNRPPAASAQRLLTDTPRCGRPQAGQIRPLPQTVSFNPDKTEQFAAIIALFAANSPPKQIYEVFISIYDLADLELKDDVSQHIHDILHKFYEDSLEMEILYSILYMGMVADNNK